jgi:hypothetical protein
MSKPSSKEIRYFLDYLSGLQTFFWTHMGDQKVLKEVEKVVEWLIKKEKEGT